MPSTATTSGKKKTCLCLSIIKSYHHNTLVYANNDTCCKGHAPQSFMVVYHHHKTPVPQKSYFCYHITQVNGPPIKLQKLLNATCKFC